MTSVLNLILLPLRAPMLLVLLLISTYLGLHWSQPGSWADVGTTGVTDVIWSVECLHSLVVVVVCTMPDLLLRRISSMMAASRVLSLVLTLLMVTIGGIYLLHLDVLSNVLILASAVLLARLDLLRLRIQPPPFALTLILCVLVLGGATVGRSLESHLRGIMPASQEVRPSPARSGASSRTTPAAAPRNEAPAPGDRAVQDSGNRGQASGTPAAAGVTAAAGEAAGRPIREGIPTSGRSTPGREPDRAVPHLQGGDTAPAGMP